MCTNKNNPYPKLEKKRYIFLIISYVSLFNKIREEKGRTGSAWKQGGEVGHMGEEEGGTNDVYTSKLM
jgi:hypothetical protein